jgi:thiamine-monophosphate kinase
LRLQRYRRDLLAGVTRLTKTTSGAAATIRDHRGFDVAPGPRTGPINREDAITVAGLGEFGLIAAIQARLPPDDALAVGAGDDAAVLRITSGAVVATTDLLVEGRHFRRDWSSPTDVGVKAAAQNLADIAAMGAQSLTLLVGLACPGELPAQWVLDMIDGMVAECRRAGASIAGGDVTAADSVMLAITALGELDGLNPVTRAGARPGDHVAVTGRLGWSAAGLALLRAGRADERDPEIASLAAAHRRPQPPYGAGPAAAMAGATAMVDVSDGLLADLGHIASASGVAINLRSADIHVDAAVGTGARLLDADAMEWVLAGGEDHALAATFPAGVRVPDGWQVVGAVQEGSGVTVDGSAWKGPAGWDHFR